MNKLKIFLESADTFPPLQEAILYGITQWRKGRPIVLGQFPQTIQSALRQQHLIGWKNFLEGLAGTEWRQLQQQHLNDQGIRKSSMRWLRGVMVRLLRLGRGQWLHRNDEKHTISRPRHKRAEQLLRRAILWLYAKRTRDLLPGDRHQMDINVCDLLQRSLRFRQSWYLNVIAARNRCLRIRYGDPQYEDPPPHHHDIRQWIRGHPL